MLNLSIAMLQSILLLALLFQNPAVSITSPQNGQTIRGQVQIVGTMDAANFSSAELAFGFSDSTNAWFTIQTFAGPVQDTTLTVWDTTSVTDGDYNLRLQVRLQDGSIQEAIVTGLKIRNDVPEPTPVILTTETFLSPADIGTATSVPSTPTLSFIRPTDLPPNPAALTVPGVYAVFGRGALAALALFV